MAGHSGFGPLFWPGVLLMKPVEPRLLGVSLAATLRSHARRSVSDIKHGFSPGFNSPERSIRPHSQA